MVKHNHRWSKGHFLWKPGGGGGGHSEQWDTQLQPPPPCRHYGDAWVYHVGGCVLTVATNTGMAQPQETTRQSVSRAAGSGHPSKKTPESPSGRPFESS